MKNKITDLNNILFEQLERLQDDSLSIEQIELEIKKSTAIDATARTIIDMANLVLKAQQLNYEYKGNTNICNPLLEGNDNA